MNLLKKIDFLIIISLFFLFVPYKINASMITEQNNLIIVNNGLFEMIIDKDSGMIENAHLIGSTQEIVSDYPAFSLFFPEYALQYADGRKEVWRCPHKDYRVGTLITNIILNTDNLGIIDIKWETGEIDHFWQFKIFPNQPYFIASIERIVELEHVYSNFQQCVMFTGDVDDAYIVNYRGEWFPTMDNNNCAPGTKEKEAVFQHSMFTAINEGLGKRFPAIVWHDDESDVTMGIIVSHVSPNQRATMSYHGGGHTKPRHPGYAEGQFNWFGKADSECLYLKKGTIMAMEMYYYFNYGDADSLDVFNQKLFNENNPISEPIDDYYAASYGTRRTYLPKYTWTFPQASNNYICSQELFYHRAISIPSSQNGTGTPHLFELSILAISGADTVDLTPVPWEPGQKPLHESATTLIEQNAMSGTVTWNINDIKSELTYKMFENSDKLLISGTLESSELNMYDSIFMHFKNSPRISEIIPVDSTIFEFAAPDDIYNNIGITLYDIEGITNISTDSTGLNLYMNFDKYNQLTNYNFTFTLFPHKNTVVLNKNQIPSFYTKPTLFYHNYFITLPGLRDNTQYGFLSDRRATIFNTHKKGNDFITVELYTDEGNYPLQFLIDEFIVNSVRINDSFITSSDFNYDSEEKILTVHTNWKGLQKIDISSELPDLPIDEIFNISNFNLLWGNGHIELSWFEDVFHFGGLIEIWRYSDNDSLKIYSQKSNARYGTNKIYDNNNLKYGKHYKYMMFLYWQDKQKSIGPIELNAITASSGIYPNPSSFDMSRNIHFTIFNKGKVKINIYNLLGQKVDTVIDNQYLPGEYTIHWKNNYNNILSTGVYFYIIELPGYTKRGNFAIIK